MTKMNLVWIVATLICPDTRLDRHLSKEQIEATVRKLFSDSHHTSDDLPIICWRPKVDRETVATLAEAPNRNRCWAA